MSFLLLLPPALILAALPESPGTQVLVTVRDIPGDPLEGVKVSLEGNQRGFDVATNSLGMASFGAIPPGKYLLKATKAGYRPQSQQLTLDGSPTLKLELRLVVEPNPAPKKPGGSASTPLPPPIQEPS
jgi:hypothetical protein